MQRSAPLPHPVAGAVAWPFLTGDRIACIGSSSTNIGVWVQTLSFLLRTRHPELGLTLTRHSTGGGTYADGMANLDAWLAEGRPTKAIFNYGANDAGGDDAGLDGFRANCDACVARVRRDGIEVVLTTPQHVDPRRWTAVEAARRTLYADAALAHAALRGVPCVDIHRPLRALLDGAQRDDASYTYMSDDIHLDEPGYVAWAMFLYDRLSPPAAISSLAIAADGRVIASQGCRAFDVTAAGGAVAFTRRDRCWPVLPPTRLPPRAHAPLERLSPYLLRVTGLAPGRYAITSDLLSVGVTDAAALDAGINLVSLALDHGHEPWRALIQRVWNGEALGETLLRFLVRPVR